MKKSRYTEEQIIAILKQHEAGVKTADLCREHGISAGDVLRLEVEVWRDGSGRGAAVEAVGRGESAPEAPGGRSEPGPGSAESGDPKKRLELVGLRQDVAFVQQEMGLSERRACRLLDLDRSSYRYERWPDRNAELRAKLVELARQKPRYRVSAIACGVAAPRPGGEREASISAVSRRRADGAAAAAQAAGAQSCRRSRG